MKVAITGATGFIGRYIVQHLANQGLICRCLYRSESDRSGFEVLEDRLEWHRGELNDDREASFIRGCDAVVHAALHHPGGGFRGGEGPLIPFAEANLVGTLKLIVAALHAGAQPFIFISTCAVHERILEDRPLDERHPPTPLSHYGAHKAAIESFVHSFGHGHGYPICALRPTGVYGIRRPIHMSKWFDLVQAVANGRDVTCRGGGKEVHAADVARAVGILLHAPGISGEVYNCYDRYISDYEIATLARKLSNSPSQILEQTHQPKHHIETGKLRALGMQFGGDKLLIPTIERLVREASELSVR